MVIVRKERFLSEKSVSYISDKIKEGCIKQTEGFIRLGVAVDIGTTSIAVGMFDMESEISIGNMTQTNCQTKYGSDVIMRIMHCVNGKEQILHDILIEQI